MNGNTAATSGRRVFLRTPGILITGSALMYPFARGVNAKEKEGKKKEEKVSPPEDLIREHGLLRRILLLYENIEGHLIKGMEFPLDVPSDTAAISR